MGSQQNTIYILLEPYPERPPRWLKGLVEFGRRLSLSLSGQLEIVALGWDEPAIEDVLFGPAVGQVHLWPEGRLSHYDGEQFAKAMACLLKREPAPILLAAETPVGRDLTRRLAAAGLARLVSNCVAIGPQSRGLKVTRMVRGGRMEKSALIPFDRPIAVTMLPQRLPYTAISKEESVRPPISIMQAAPSELKIEPLGLRRIHDAGESLEEAEVVVAGGWGASGEEGFALVTRLAHALGGAVAGSAVAAEQGWISRSQQIGRSGRTVYPELFIACGISGSVHFTSGMDSSKMIVAINTDPDAPIFKLADVQIVGDLKHVIPIVIDRVLKWSRS
jgi:electron transfer flavoprotein alpha subunit